MTVLYVDKKGKISIVTAGQGAIAAADPDRKKKSLARDRASWVASFRNMVELVSPSKDKERTERKKNKVDEKR